MGGLSIGPIFWALMAVSAVAAVAYGFYFLRRPPGFLRALVKTAFMGAAAGALFSAGAPFPLVAAIACSALGDFFLAFKDKWTLPLGILAFLLAQLIYVLMFTAIWFFSGDNSPLWPRYAAMVLVAAVALAFLVWFWRQDLRRAPLTGALCVFTVFAVGMLIPAYLALAAMPAAVVQLVNWLAALIGTQVQASPAPQAGLLLTLLLVAVVLVGIRRDLGATRLAAMFYAGALVSMAIAAMWLPWVGWPAMIGAVSFLISDLVLAAELFRLPADAPARRWTSPVVWWTYAAAQALIVTGLVLIVLQR